VSVIFGRSRAAAAPGPGRVQRSTGWDAQVIAAQLQQYQQQLVTTYGTNKAEAISADFYGHVTGGMYRSGVLFSVLDRRLKIFSGARFQWQRLATSGGPSDLYGDPTLTILEKPWKGGNTIDLLGRIITHADHAGNSYTVNRRGEAFNLRPDWVEIILSPRMLPVGAPTDEEPNGKTVQVGYEKVGYFYYEGGKAKGLDPAVFLADEVAHFAPIPDPLAEYRGMSWITPILRELAGDKLATEHGIAFLERGATPNLVVTLPRETTTRQYNLFKSAYKESHEGAENAYRTLLLTSGADVTPVGVNMKDLDMAKLRALSETRIAMAGGIHPVVLFSSEGMQGSSLNAGNYKAAKGATADETFRPLWANVCASLEMICPPAPGVRLWYDERSVPFLREDMQEQAEIKSAEATTINQLVLAGYTPDSAVAAVMQSNWKLLQHSGLFSVQLQPAGATPPAPTGGAGA
jgi:phage portal protein BeeE